MKDNLITKNKEYQSRTYNDLSSEFQKLYHSAVRAFELIGLMYDRLTLVEKLSHKVAVAKIHNDHRHLAGFSKRNITRNLPLNNPSVPRRVRPSWPKNSINETNEPSKLSNTGHIQGKNPKLSLTHGNEGTRKNSTNLATKAAAQPMESSSCKILYLKNCELKEALEKTSQLTTADNIAFAAAAASINEIHNKNVQCDILHFEFHLAKQEILDHMGEPYLSINNGDLKIWFSGKIDKKNGHVISVKLGRISQQRIDYDNRGDVQNE
jgi:hypothetical protein